MAEIALITGGCRSGKSRYALELAASCPRKAFIATAQAHDEEMRERIARHKAERGKEWMTIEEPLDLTAALQQGAAMADVVVADCLTAWLGNLLHLEQSVDMEHPAITAFFVFLSASYSCRIILVSNEVGMGIVPDNAMARQFRDLAGGVNQRVAHHADNVTLMVSGLPLQVKSAPVDK